MFDQPSRRGEYYVLYEKDFLRYVKPFMYCVRVHYGFNLKDYLWDQVEGGRPKEELDYHDQLDAIVSSNWFRRIEMSDHKE